MGIFFTSDTHYHHKNICLGVSEWKDKSGCRNFSTIEEMNDKIVDGINSVVKWDDVLWHLGDFSFGGMSKLREFRSRINCQNIHLIFGNHDENIITNRDGIQDLFSSCGFYNEISYEGTKIILSHYGFRVWNNSHKGSWMLYGHSHGTLSGLGKSMDVGIDTNPNFRPYSIKEISKLMNSKKVHFSDGHSKNDHI